MLEGFEEFEEFEGALERQVCAIGAARFAAPVVRPPAFVRQETFEEFEGAREGRAMRFASRSWRRRP
jgi:hypothetical protein